MKPVRTLNAAPAVQNWTLPKGKEIALSANSLNQLRREPSKTTDKVNASITTKKDSNLDANFAICHVTVDFGETVGWKVVAGRDFSEKFATDTTDAVIINEAAAKYMGLDNPVGQALVDVDEFGNPKWSKTIIGVVKDILMQSPYDPVQQTLYYFKRKSANLLHVKISPEISASVALPKIKAAFDKVAPAALFEYKFVDQEYALKFGQEVRIGKLSAIFSVLAIFISCLGLFGLASFVAEQRTKEIGIRKILGATVSNLWQMLSRDFVKLVFISCVIAVPVGYYFMNDWLAKYEYRTEISWWIFVATALGALAITLLTVSYQAIMAALRNPVKSLRSE